MQIKRVKLLIIVSILITSILLYLGLTDESLRFYNLGEANDVNFLINEPAYSYFPEYDCTFIEQFVPRDEYYNCPFWEDGNINNRASIESCEEDYQRIKDYMFDELLGVLIKKEYLSILSYDDMEILYSDLAYPSFMCVLANDNIIHIRHFRMGGCRINHIFLLPKTTKHQSLKDILKLKYASMVEQNQLITTIPCSEIREFKSAEGCQYDRRDVIIYLKDDFFIFREKHITCP